MGLISLIKNVAGTTFDSISSQVQDQYLEFFTQDSLGQDILVKKGANKMERGRNKGNSEVISNGSIINVPEGCFCLLVNNGEIVDVVSDAGAYKWDTSTAPSILANKNFGENVKQSIGDIWNRMKMGGEIQQQQRVYFVNKLEMMNQNFGTPSPVPYADPEYRNIYIRLNGTFSFRVENPVTFFRNIVGNVKDEYTVADFMGTPAKPQQPRLEFLDNITETLNKCGGPYPNGIMFSTLPSKQGEFRRYMQDCLDDEWLQKRGIVVEKVAIASVTPDDKSRERIEKVDESKLYGQDQAALGAAVALGQTEAMKNAGANANGAVNGFMGLGMMGAVGGNNATAAALNTVQANQGQPQTGFFAGQTAAPAGAPAAAGWTCSCGQTGNTGKFWGNCGQPQPAPVAPAAGWTCSCGQTGNTGKFCGNCGAPAPAAAPTACPKCGYKPADGNMPKFCPECGTKIE